MNDESPFACTSAKAKNNGDVNMLEKDERKHMQIYDQLMIIKQDLKL